MQSYSLHWIISIYSFIWLCQVLAVACALFVYNWGAFIVVHGLCSCDQQTQQLQHMCLGAPQHVESYFSACKHAKLLQSCPALCDPMDCNHVHGILQARIWSGVHALLQGIFLTQRLNLHLLWLLHWQAGSLPRASPEKSQGSNLCPLHCKANS